MSNSTTTVEVRGLTVRFGQFTAVDRISFSVHQGEIFGFLGANGAGKTTTIRVLCGLLVPTEGEVRLSGVEISSSPLVAKKQVGYMSQKFTLYDDLTVDENLSFAASLRKLDPQVYQRRRNDLLEFIAFSYPGNTLVRDLPGGIKQQVSLAASLLHDPAIVFLDEPTAGVTPAARSRFWALIRKLADQAKTVFVTTHYMDEAEHCGRIALMREGKIIAIDTPSGLKKSTFKERMIELDPIHSLSFEELSALKANPLFDLIEPYGLRFHASIADIEKWKKVETEFQNKFRIRTIQPSLEDVFIRLVEGKPQ